MKLTDITVSRTIPAPAEEVFDVWIDPKSPGGPWFGADRVILNPVVDRWVLSMLAEPFAARPTAQMPS
jgi:uncharacterized protein YndB with AHSA1/START domain